MFDPRDHLGVKGLRRRKVRTFPGYVGRQLFRKGGFAGPRTAGDEIDLIGHENSSQLRSRVVSHRHDRSWLPADY
jgi:hypothetical protein